LLKRPQTIVVTAVGLLLLLLLNLPSGAAARLKLAVGGLFLPLLGVSGASQSFVDMASYELLPRSTLVSEVQRLEKENATLRLEAALGAEAAAENQRLRAQLGSLPRGSWRPKLARVVGRDASTWWRTCLIDYGARDGAAVNLPVVTAQGLVGRIAVVGHSHSQVALIGDASCGVAVLVSETRDHGIIAGGQQTTDVGIVELTTFQQTPSVMAGQSILTSGEGGVFPKGLAVGTVIDARPARSGLFTSARVRLGAHLNRLEEVWVLLP
jgi:rod shape-determining protein MreC